MSEIDWTSTPEPMAKAILRQSEMYLATTVTLGIAADQRAATLVGIFSAFATAVAGGVAIELSSATPKTALVAGGTIMSLMLASSAIMCVVSMMPAKMAIAGSEPKQWWEVAGRPLKEVIGGETENYQKGIDTNIKLLKRNADWFSVGALLGCAAPFVGFFFVLLL